jgi:hypothetical protein
MVTRYLRLAERMVLNELETKKLTLLKACSKVSLEKLPEGSLGVLLK